MNGLPTYAHAEAHIRDIRHADLEALRHFFRPGARVLEIGGGNGYQASVMAGWGCEVSSIDIQPPPEGEASYYPVTLYDGERLPFEDGAFDIVFSCYVLEHVPVPELLLREALRVLAPGGCGLHIVPSATWRWWTILTHYPHLLRRLAGATATREDPMLDERPSAGVPVRSFWRRLMISGAHGEYPSAMAELYYFSEHRWRRVFAESGYRVVEVLGNGLFYTGYRLLPMLPPSARRKLSRLLGSACHMFVVSSAL